MKKGIGVLLVLTGLSTTASGAVSLSGNRDDCARGWISLNVAVTVDSERFNFNPSCNFSYSQRFTTSDGEDCRIESGMCSAFGPRARIEVDCRAKGSDAMTIECPAARKSDNPLIPIDDGRSPRKGR